MENATDTGPSASKSAFLVLCAGLGQGKCHGVEAGALNKWVEFKDWIAGAITVGFENVEEFLDVVVSHSMEGLKVSCIVMRLQTTWRERL